VASNRVYEGDAVPLNGPGEYESEPTLLDRDGTYMWVATAYDRDGNELWQGVCGEDTEQTLQLTTLVLTGFEEARLVTGITAAATMLLLGLLALLKTRRRPVVSGTA
jgi:hypothetical protein